MDNSTSHVEDKVICTPDTVGDPYLQSELAIPRIGFDSPQLAKVTKRKKSDSGEPIGTAHDNPLLDTRTYIVEYLDGHEEAMHTNLIAEHMYSQVNTNGERFLLLNEITDHRCDDSKVITLTNSFTKSNNNVLSRKHTTDGWDLLVSWKDGSSNWVSLKDLKESYPVEIAEYAKIKGITTEPAFAWWVNYVIRKKSAIISKIK